MMILAVAAISVAMAYADDRPVAFNQLPQPAQTFMNTYFPGVRMAFATVEDDLIKPDYQVVLTSGVMITFRNDGRLEKIETRKGGIPSGIMPVQITEMIKDRYPGVEIVEYEVGRKTYEVTLSNNVELKFNRDFNVIEIDD